MTVEWGLDLSTVRRGDLLAVQHGSHVAVSDLCLILSDVERIDDNKYIRWRLRILSARYRSGEFELPGPWVSHLARLTGIGDEP